MLAFLLAIQLLAVPPVTTLPDPKLTPGDLLPVTGAKVCVPGYATAARKKVGWSRRVAVFMRYGYAAPLDGFEIDHLLSLELGGSNAITNEWPQSYTGKWNAHMKDNLENILHAAVCTTKTLTLPQAQMLIRTNWIAAYQKYMK